MESYQLPIIFQEAVKQCYSVEANCYKTKGSKKDKEMIVWFVYVVLDSILICSLHKKIVLQKYI